MRIEQEEKLLVPMEIADDVLAFLKHRYVEDKTRLQELNPRFTSSFDVEDFTDADPETRRYMESVLAQIVGEIRAHFPAIESNLTPKYGKAFYALEAKIPFLRRLVGANLHHGESLASLVLVAIAVVGFGGALLWRAVATALQQRSRGVESPTA